MTVKLTAKQEIMRVLAVASRPLAVHEIAREMMGYSENNLATRCSELARAGRIQGRIRKGFAYKEWGVPETMAAAEGDECQTSMA